MKPPCKRKQENPGPSWVRKVGVSYTGGVLLSLVHCFACKPPNIANCKGRRWDPWDQFPFASPGVCVSMPMLTYMGCIL